MHYILLKSHGGGVKRELTDKPSRFLHFSSRENNITRKGGFLRIQCINIYKSGRMRPGTK